MILYHANTHPRYKLEIVKFIASFSIEIIDIKSVFYTIHEDRLNKLLDRINNNLKDTEYIIDINSMVIEQAKYGNFFIMLI